MVLSTVRSVVDDVTTKAILHVVEKKSENDTHFLRHRVGQASSNSTTSSLKEILPRIKRIIYIGLSCLGLFLASCYTYGILYFLVIPTNYATVPIHFDYNWKPSHHHPSLKQHYHNNNCSTKKEEQNNDENNNNDNCYSKSLLYENDRVMYPPTATIHLLHDHTQWRAHVPDVAPKKPNHETTTTKPQSQKYTHILQTHQPYFIDIALTLPETDINRELGIFMVEIDLKTNNNNNYNHIEDDDSQILLASSSRLSMLPYESSYLSLARQTLFMIPYLLGAIPQARTVVVKCFDRYVEAANYPLVRIDDSGTNISYFSVVILFTLFLNIFIVFCGQT